MLKIEHIGIAVKDFANAIPLFTKLLNSQCYKTEAVESQRVNTAFFKTGSAKVELLQDISDDGIIKKFIEKKGEGIHHIAFEVPNIYEEIKRLKAEGFTIINEIPTKGADNKLVCFLHPKDTNGVMIELCMEQQ